MAATPPPPAATTTGPAVAVVSSESLLAGIFDRRNLCSSESLLAGIIDSPKYLDTVLPAFTLNPLHCRNPLCFS
ncbi:hypothetical protein Tco_0038395 [Tanacetum coccineum]